MYICIYPGALCTHAMIFLVFRSSFGTNNLYNSFCWTAKGGTEKHINHIISYHIKISLLISATHDGAKKKHHAQTYPNPFIPLKKNMLDVRIRVWWVDGLTYDKPK